MKREGNLPFLLTAAGSAVALACGGVAGGDRPIQASSLFGADCSATSFAVQQVGENDDGTATVYEAGSTQPVVIPEAIVGFSCSNGTESVWALVQPTIQLSASYNTIAHVIDDPVRTSGGKLPQTALFDQNGTEFDILVDHNSLSLPDFRGANGKSSCSTLSDPSLPRIQLGNSQTRRPLEAVVEKCGAGTNNRPKQYVTLVERRGPENLGRKSLDSAAISDPGSVVLHDGTKGYSLSKRNNKLSLSAQRSSNRGQQVLLLGRTSSTPNTASRRRYLYR